MHASTHQCESVCIGVCVYAMPFIHGGWSGPVLTAPSAARCLSLRTPPSASRLLLMKLQYLSDPPLRPFTGAHATPVRKYLSIASIHGSGADASPAWMLSLIPFPSRFSTGARPCCSIFCRTTFTTVVVVSPGLRTSISTVEPTGPLSSDGDGL
jgi:hypothetical protein